MPQTTVAAIVTQRGSGGVNIVLTRRRIYPFKDCWCFPGGHIDQYEPAEQAICREVQEETGLTFSGQFFRYFDEIIPEHHIHAVVIVFEGSGQGTFRIQEEEVADIRWFSLDKAKSLSLAFTHNEILDTWMTDRQLNFE